MWLDNVYESVKLRVLLIGLLIIMYTRHSNFIVVLQCVE